MGATERVRELILPILEAHQVQLYDLEHESGVLRVMVDRPGGIDVDTIGDMAHLISQALDLDDPLPDSRYLLEVTSPGIERKLRTPAHFQAVVGEEINVKVHANVEGDRRFEARLVAADEQGIDVTDGVDEEAAPRRLAYEDIESARTIFHWGEQTDSPGKKTNNSKTTKKKASAR